MLAFCFPVKTLFDDQFYGNIRIKKVFLCKLSK